MRRWQEEGGKVIGTHERSGKVRRWEEEGGKVIGTLERLGR